VFRDAREIADGEVLETDVCIVGTGAAGVTCAVELLSSGLRVLVLEAGGLKHDPATEALGELECVGLPVSPTSRQRFFGGTTNSWWGKVALLDEADFVARDHVAGSGWPFGRAQLMPYYRRACEIMGMPDLTARPASNGGGAAEIRSETLDVKAFYWPRTPLNFGDLYRRRLRGSRNIATILRANVARVVPGPNGRIDEVEVATANGRRFSVRGRCTILACGGIENARLLLNSGVGNDLDQAGRYYMDHPRGHCGSIEASREVSALSPAYWSGKRFGALRVRLGISLSPEAQSRSGSLNSYVNLTPAYEGAGVKAIRELYRRRLGALRDGSTARQLVTGIPDIVRYLRFKRSGRGWVRSVSVDNYLEQEPRAANRITLSDRKDSFGQPLARVDWSLSDQDRHTMRTLHAALGDELKRRGIGVLRSPLLAGGEDDFPTLNDAAHHLGGTRMGDDPRTSVVDGDGRVHGSAGLYIAGSSVFPTGGSANPTLTIVALAARLAEHVRSTLRN
jgi:choline dehydrogenase-like flavoprotein